MIKKIYNQVIKGQEVRKNLIELRKELKDYNNQRAFLYELEGDYAVLYKLLQDEDAKVRKNIALIMGQLAVPEFMHKLYEAYTNEEKLFVKSDYLTAISYFDYRPLLQEFKTRLDYLTENTFEDTSIKHIQEEIRILTEMMLRIEVPETHEFKGYKVLSDIILLTNREHQQVTLEQIHSGKAKVFNAGVVVRTDNLGEILKIRTYTELLFRLPSVGSVDNTPQAAAEAIYQGGLLEFLSDRHEGEVPYYFRIELKSKLPLDKKSAFTKKMAAELERVSNRKLINSTSSYEVEIRLIENKEGMLNVLLKLYTIKDNRFQYRVNTVAASIAPVNAALVATLAQDYLKKGAEVLDPFCGVGTMLIERNKIVKAGHMYGVDIFGEAIGKAMENAERDRTDIYFINRDTFDFTHKYQFDEIFTNMPTRGGRKTSEDMEMLYNRFFVKALELLKEEAIIVMYTRDADLVNWAIRNRKEYTVLKQYEISKKEEAYVYIIGVQK